jgi:hypothetical protein
MAETCIGYDEYYAIHDFLGCRVLATCSISLGKREWQHTRTAFLVVLFENRVMVSRVKT